jgi:hypothetical protein
MFTKTKRGAPGASSTASALSLFLRSSIGLALMAWAASRAHACGGGWAPAVVKAVLVSAVSIVVAMAAATPVAWMALVFSFGEGGNAAKYRARGVVLGALALATLVGVTVGGAGVMTRC